MVTPILLGTRPKALARLHDLVPGAEPRQWFKIENAADPNEARIDIYDAIDSWGGAPGEESFWGGISAEGFGRVLATVTAPRIALHVNSPGGDVFDGIAIMNALIQHPAHVTAYVDGIAASIASVIIMAADEVEMGLGAQIMIHNASGFAFGTAEDMQAAADLLGKVSDNIATVYAARTGVELDHWTAAMDAESWYNADEAVTARLADRVTPVEQRGGQPADDHKRWIHAAYRYGSREQAPAPQIAAPTATSAPDPASVQHTAPDQTPDPTPVAPVAVLPDLDASATAAEIIRNAFSRKVAAQ